MNALPDVDDLSSCPISPTWLSSPIPPDSPESGDRWVSNDPPLIDGYQIKATIGRGGMGIVYLAEDLALGREVALKVLPSAKLGDPDSIERFRHEARALARIHHPNIVPIHSIGETATAHWFAMGLVRGEALSAVIHAAATGEPRLIRALPTEPLGGPSRGLLAESRAAMTVRIGRQLALALDQVHAAGLVHRDVKPANVRLDERGDPVLVDFGVACDPKRERLPVFAVAPGTLRFMPPELLGSVAADPDPRADLYALGATLYELATLSPAFGQEETGSLIDAIVHGRFERPRHIDDSVPRALDEVIARAMASDPAARYPTGREFAKALDDAATPKRRSMIRSARDFARKIPAAALIAGAAITLGVTAGLPARAAREPSGKITLNANGSLRTSPAITSNGLPTAQPRPDAMIFPAPNAAAIAKYETSALASE